MGRLDDSEIIALFMERSEQALVELKSKYGAVVRRTAENILGDRLDAEECVNDAWLAAWNTIPPQQPQSLVSYVCRLARNQSLKKRRADTARKRDSRYDLALDELSDCLPAVCDVEGAYTARELSAAVSRCLASLEYLDRYCFVRRYWYGDAVGEIAAQTGLSPRRVSVRLYRTRGKIQQYLKKEGLLE